MPDTEAKDASRARRVGAGDSAASCTDDAAPAALAPPPRSPGRAPPRGRPRTRLPCGYGAQREDSRRRRRRLHDRAAARHRCDRDGLRRRGRRRRATGPD